MATFARPGKMLSGTPRLIWVVALGVILLMGGLQAFSRWRAHERVTEEQKNKLAYQTRLVYERVSSTILAFRAAIETISEEASPGSICDQDLVTRYKALHSSARSFSVADSRGVIRCSSNRDLVGLDRSSADYFVAAKNTLHPNIPVLSSPRKALTGAPVVTFYKSVTDEAGNLQKVVVANFELRVFDELLASLIAEEQSAFIAHEDGVVASRVPDPEKFRYKNLLTGGSSFLQLHLDQHKPLTHHRAVGAISGKDSFSVIQNLVPEGISPSSRLFVGVTEPADHIFQRWREDTAVYLLAWLVASAGILGMAFMVSQRQKQYIQARDVAIAASKAKSQFLSSMSHELRTPLNAILGFAQLTEMSTQDREIRNNTNHILSAGWHLLALIDEVLDLARIEAGQMRLSLEPVELQGLLRECVSLSLALAEKRRMRISMTSDEPGSGRCMAMADRIRLKQSILNYISNAVKYGQEGSEVRIALRNDGNRAWLGVTNDGEGIAAEKLPELFRPFSRLGLEGGNIEGVGLGLALTKEMVELMGGRVGAESVPGQSTLFWMELVTAGATLQQDAKTRNLPRAPGEHEVAQKNARVLCVEDNPANAELVKTVFARLCPEMELTIVPDGKKALEIAPQLRPHVLLLDIHLPGMDGIELLGRLRADGINAPAIALTAAAMPDDVARGQEAGFFDYLPKPLVAETFLETLNRALEAAARPRKA